ncbi:hypothetical protein HGI30_14965 [Paenibacillus albicereus]|uniref:Uncharacterized protein n=1 Tax=Paenibacillus albicereus TaxID=2726185 RepID=A0A6H2GZ71_9BACL|nr:hypothetical protein [Paenibacillus albicereus]QJC52733.1 hypothetical protein HGI30_14965 [Paenibacillus albicereus]
MEPTFENVAKYLINESGKCASEEKLYALLSMAAHTIGGMVCHFDTEARSDILMRLTAAMGIGYQVTAKAIGEPSSIEIILGDRP